MIIEITNRCNLNCSYCHSYPNVGGELALSDERLLKLFEECKENQFKSVIITGGEPLLSKRVFFAAKVAKSYGLKTDLCTNGTILNEQLLEQIKKYYDGVTVTLDTIDPEVYTLMKGCSKEQFHHVIGHMKSLIAAGMKVGTTIVLTKQNVNCIKDTLEYMSEIGVNKVSLLRLYNFTSQYNDFVIPYSDDTIRNIKSAVEQFPDMDIRFKGWDFSAHTCPPCTAGKYLFSIEHGGHLLPCILLRENSSDCNLSNVSLQEAMQSKTIEDMKHQMKNMPECDCVYDKHCGKGCPATAYGYGKQIVADVRCNQKVISWG